MSPILGEIVGTAVLVLLGDGVVANVVLNKSKGQNSGWMVIATGWAFAVMTGVLTAIAFGSSDAHLNPAVTVAFAMVSGDYSKLATYIPAQLLGAAIGAVLVWLAYLPHWDATEDGGAKLACFSTGPAVPNPIANFLTEAVATLVWVLGVAAIFSKAVSITGPAPVVGPFILGALCWGVGCSLGGPTGYAINPARDLGPRIIHALLPLKNKGSSDWGYAWVPVAGPVAGGAVAALILRAVA